MKENATHIRLIRKDGKPVEAEYQNWDPKDRYELKDFVEWAKANRIPVTGDWPTDRNVFAKDEVETERFQLDGEWVEYVKLRLKATLSDSPENDKQKDLTSQDDRQSEPLTYEVFFSGPTINGWYEVPVSRIKDLEQGLAEGFVRVKEEPEQGQSEVTVNRATSTGVIRCYNDDWLRISKPGELTVANWVQSKQTQSELTVKEGEDPFDDNFKCITFDKEAQEAIPADIREGMNKDKEQAKAKKTIYRCDCGGFNFSDGVCDLCGSPAKTAEGISSVTGEKFTLIKSPVIDPLREKWIEDIYQTSFKNMGEAVVWIFENVHNPYVSLMELAKQQYQQEIIEKLEAASAELSKSLPKGTHIDALGLLKGVKAHLQSLEEIIQSTK